jgi:hypothetical protein
MKMGLLLEMTERSTYRREYGSERFANALARWAETNLPELLACPEPMQQRLPR